MDSGNQKVLNANSDSPYRITLKLDPAVDYFGLVPWEDDRQYLESYTDQDEKIIKEFIFSFFNGYLKKEGPQPFSILENIYRADIDLFQLVSKFTTTGICDFLLTSDRFVAFDEIITISECMSNLFSSFLSQETYNYEMLYRPYEVKKQKITVTKSLQCCSLDDPRIPSLERIKELNAVLNNAKTGSSNSTVSPKCYPNLQDINEILDTEKGLDSSSDSVSHKSSVNEELDINDIEDIKTDSKTIDIKSDCDDTKLEINDPESGYISEDNNHLIEDCNSDTMETPLRKLNNEFPKGEKYIENDNDFTNSKSILKTKRTDKEITETSIQSVQSDSAYTYCMTNPSETLPLRIAVASLIDQLRNCNSLEIFLNTERFTVLSQISDYKVLTTELTLLIQNYMKSMHATEKKHVTFAVSQPFCIEIKVNYEIVELSEIITLFIIKANLYRIGFDLCAKNLSVNCINIYEKLHKLDEFYAENLKQQQNSNYSHVTIKDNQIYPQGVETIISNDNSEKLSKKYDFNNTNVPDTNLLNNTFVKSSYTNNHNSYVKKQAYNPRSSNRRGPNKVYSLQSFQNTHFSSAPINYYDFQDQLLLQKLNQAFFFTLKYTELFHCLSRVQQENGGTLSGLTYDKIVERIRNIVMVNGHIQNPPNFQYGTDNYICAICINSLKRHNMFRLNCGHVFHAFCIREWLKLKNICPVCRKVSDFDEFPPLV